MLAKIDGLDVSLQLLTTVFIAGKMKRSIWILLIITSTILQKALMITPKQSMFCFSPTSLKDNVRWRTISEWAMKLRTQIHFDISGKHFWFRRYIRVKSSFYGRNSLCLHFLLPFSPFFTPQIKVSKCCRIDLINNLPCLCITILCLTKSNSYPNCWVEERSIRPRCVWDSNDPNICPFCLQSSRTSSRVNAR